MKIQLTGTGAAALKQTTFTLVDFECAFAQLHQLTERQFKHALLPTDKATKKQLLERLLAFTCLCEHMFKPANGQSSLFEVNIKNGEAKFKVINDTLIINTSV